MIDYGYPLRQNFIRSSESLEAKRAALRERMHAEKRALVGEESEAKRQGWKVFQPHKGWASK